MNEDNARGRVELKIGSMSFIGEGSQDWLDGQISKLLEAVGAQQNASTNNLGGPSSEATQERAPNNETLASYLKAKGGDTRQVQRFLATAGWLKRRGDSLTTSNVVRALKENQQKRLGNPPDCLNQNVAKGFIEKTADGFLLTLEGWQVLGEQQ